MFPARFSITVSNKALLVLLLAMVITKGYGQRQQTNLQFDSKNVLDRLKQDVYSLSADSMIGRAPGTVFEKKAAAYIAREFSKAGIPYTMQAFDVNITGDSILHCNNVVALINHHADSTIILGAHYDHLGMGSNKSYELLKRGIHPGADDNASGVATLLELARFIKQQGIKKYNYLLVAFTAHEIGLYGSGNFIKSKDFNDLHVKGFINFDMVGRLDEREKKLKVSYNQPAEQLIEMILSKASPAFTIVKDDEEAVTNDYTVFATQGIPALSFTTGTHDDYHRMSDVASKLNYDGMQAIIEKMEETILAI